MLRFRQQSIHLREKQKHIRLRDRIMRSVLLARREGYAFFDEDDVCAVLWNFVAAI